MASVFKRDGDKRWTIAWYDHKGNRRREGERYHATAAGRAHRASYSDKELERVRAGRSGGRAALDRARPLSEHFNDYQAHLETRAATIGTWAYDAIICGSSRKC